MNKLTILGVISFTFFSSTIFLSTRPTNLLKKITLTALYSMHGLFAVLGMITLNGYLAERTGSNNLELIKSGITLLFILSIISGALGLISALVAYLQNIRQFRDKWFKRHLILWIHRLSLVSYTLFFYDLLRLFFTQQTYFPMIFILIMYVGLVVIFIHYQGPKKRNLRYIIKENKALSPNLNELIIEPVDKIMTATDNQFLFLKALDPAISSESHPFSLIVEKCNNQLKLVIKNSGDYTKKVPHWKKGSLVSLEGPYTNFPTIKKNKSDMLLIAGGIGITAFISLIKEILIEDNRYQLTLLWSVAYENEAFYQAELVQLAQKYDNFSYHIFVTRENSQTFVTKKISSVTIQEYVKFPSYNQTEVFISASSLMSKMLTKELVSLNFDKKKIQVTSFMF